MKKWKVTTTYTKTTEVYADTEQEAREQGIALEGPLKEEDCDAKLTEVTATLEICEANTKLINALLGMTGDEIYQKYGMKRDETVRNSVRFDDEFEADFKLVVSEGDEKPYTEGILFRNGYEVARSEVEEDYFGEWYFECDGIEYMQKERKNMDPYKVLGVSRDATDDEIKISFGFG